MEKQKTAFDLIPKNISEQRLLLLQQQVNRLALSFTIKFPDNPQRVFTQSDFIFLASKLKNSIYPISLKTQSETNNADKYGMQCNINNIKISIWKKLSVKIEGGIEIIAAVQSVQDVINDLLNQRYNNEPHMFTETIIENNQSEVELKLDYQLFDKTIDNFCNKHGGSYSYTYDRENEVITLAYKRLKEGRKIKQPKITIKYNNMSVIGSFSLEKMLQLEKDLYQSQQEIKQINL